MNVDERQTTDSKAVRNDSLYIIAMMAAKVCQGLFIPFIVAPEEADSQCRFALLEGQPPEMLVTGHAATKESNDDYQGEGVGGHAWTG